MGSAKIIQRTEFSSAQDFTRSLSENATSTSFRRKSESRDAHVYWIPAFAGMTEKHQNPILGQAPRELHCLNKEVSGRKPL